MALFFFKRIKNLYYEDKFSAIGFISSQYFRIFILFKKNDESTSTLQVRMTDAPTALEQVNVDIQSVRIKYRDDANDSTLNWVNLNTTAGIYSLLSLQNGIAYCLLVVLYLKDK